MDAAGRCGEQAWGMAWPGRGHRVSASGEWGERNQAMRWTDFGNGMDDGRIGPHADTRIHVELVDPTVLVDQLNRRRSSRAVPTPWTLDTVTLLRRPDSAFGDYRTALAHESIEPC